MKFTSKNVPINTYAQNQSVIINAIETTFTGGSAEGGMLCTAVYEVRIEGTDSEVEMPLISGGTIDLTPFIPPELAAGIEAWFNAITPALLRRLAPKTDEEAP